MVACGYVSVALGIWVYLYSMFSGSAIHEIEAFVLFLIAAVTIGSARIIEAINRLPRIEKPLDR